MCPCYRRTAAVEQFTLVIFIDYRCRLWDDRNDMKARGVDIRLHVIFDQEDQTRKNNPKSSSSILCEIWIFYLISEQIKIMLI